MRVSPLPEQNGLEPELGRACGRRLLAGGQGGSARRQSGVEMAMRGGRDGAALVTAGCRALARSPPPARMQQGRPSLCCVAAVRSSRGAPEPGEGGTGLGEGAAGAPQGAGAASGSAERGRGDGEARGVLGRRMGALLGGHGEERGARGGHGGSSPRDPSLFQRVRALCHGSELSPLTCTRNLGSLGLGWRSWGGAGGALGCATAAAAPATEQSLRRSLLCHIPGWFPPLASPLSHLLPLCLPCLASSPVCSGRGGDARVQLLPSGPPAQPRVPLVLSVPVGLGSVSLLPNPLLKGKPLPYESGLSTKFYG